MKLRRWLTPGIGIKRWMLVGFAGMVLLAVAFAHFLRQITRDLEPTGPAGAVIDLLTLQFLPFAVRGFTAASVGVLLVLLGAYRVAHVLTDPLRRAAPDQPLVEVIYQKRFLARGPRIRVVDPTARAEGTHEQSHRDRHGRRRRRVLRSPAGWSGHPARR